MYGILCSKINNKIFHGKRLNTEYILFSVFFFINYPLLNYLFIQIFPILSPNVIELLLQVVLYGNMAIIFFNLYLNEGYLRKRKVHIYLLFYFLVVFITFVIHQSYLIDRSIVLLKAFLNCYLLFLVIYLFGNVDLFIKSMHKGILLNTGLAIVYYLIIHNNQSIISTQGQTISYIILLYICMAIYFIFRRFRLSELLCFLADLFLIFQFGSRTILLMIIAYFLIESISLYIKTFISSNTKKRTVLLVVGITVLLLLLLVVISIQYLASLVYDHFVSLGIHNRFLRLLANGEFITQSSGRIDSFYSLILDDIVRNPFGNGLAYDRVVLFNDHIKNGAATVVFEGSYSHNFFLEYFHTFGIFIGIVAIIFFVRNYALTIKNNMDIVLLFSIIGFFPLLLTSSFLVFKNFWIFVAILILLKERSTV